MSTSPGTRFVPGVAVVAALERLDFVLDLDFDDDDDDDEDDEDDDTGGCLFTEGS